jgi:hypothetical protein
VEPGNKVMRNDDTQAKSRKTRSKFVCRTNYSVVELQCTVEEGRRAKACGPHMTSGKIT